MPHFASADGAPTFEEVVRAVVAAAAPSHMNVWRPYLARQRGVRSRTSVAASWLW